MRCQYEVGDIIFYETESFVGRVIRSITGHPHSHVAVVVSENNEVIEATAFSRSKLVRLNDTDFKKIRVLRANLTYYDKACLMENHESLLGVPYDYKGIWTLFKRIVFNKDTDLIDRDVTRLWCSEMVDHLYNECGIKLVPHINNSIVDIKDLEESPILQEVEVVTKDQCPL